ncbi:MAG: SRPBCC domain-containing protein [Myxococcota bacterium]
MMLETGAPTGPVVGLSAEFRAPRGKVFDAWTQPALLSKWFFVEAGYRTHDVIVDLAPLRPYQIVVTPDAGESTRIHGTFVQVVPGERLVYTWTGACADEQYWTLVNVTFADKEGGGSRVELDHGVFRTDADRAMHEQGWFACVSGLDRLLSEG